MAAGPITRAHICRTHYSEFDQTQKLAHTHYLKKKEKRETEEEQTDQLPFPHTALRATLRV